MSLFSLHELQNITDNFSDQKLVGRGAYGAVYKAPYNGGEIAVKKLHQLAGIDDKAFDNEFLRSLSQIHHQNVVQLIGYCQESQRIFVEHGNEMIVASVMERILCFEYMHGGSLDKHITDDLCDLDWPICYKIIRGTCEGLNHLHNELGKPIYHLDLKPANILLDKDLTPKIADLGLSRVVNTTTTRKTEKLALQGTLFGYMPPEYINNGSISKKFDVYSFGGIIVRIMDGNNCSSRFSDMGTQEFIKHVMENWKRRLQGTSRFQSPEKGILQARKCLDIALRCVETDRWKRPSIKDIVDELEELEARINEISLHSDQSEGTVDQIKSDTRVVAVDPKELRFLFAPRKDLSACLRLTNLTDGFVAFNIKTNQGKYRTQPNKGIIPPCSRCYISVTLRAQEAAPPNMQCNDLFVVESANVHEEFTSHEITEGFFKDDQLMAGKVEEQLPIVYVETIIDEMSLDSDQSEGTIGQLQQQKIEGRLIDQEQHMASWQGNPPPSETTPQDLTLSLLERITNNFGDEVKVGSCGFGEVYLGIYRGEKIAVKKLYDRNLGFNDEAFIKEFNNTMKLHHPNTVRLVGYCFEMRHKHIEIKKGEYEFARIVERVLCFEYCQGGSLSKYIYEEFKERDLETRLQIIRGIAEGLDYLHNGQAQRHMYHLDLKPENILLDEKNMPKIADFGLSRFLAITKTQITSTCKGTTGYMPPEYINQGRISSKFDVFSLGVIILQVLAVPLGYLKCYDTSPKCDDNMHPREFVEHVHANWNERPPVMTSSELHRVKEYIDLALRCLQVERESRPKIADIVRKLKDVDEQYYVGPSSSKGATSQDTLVTAFIGMAMERHVTASFGPMAPLLQKVVCSLELMAPFSNDFKEHLEVLCRDLLEPEETSSMPKWWRKEVRELLYDTEDRLDKIILLQGGNFSELIAGVEDAYERRKRVKLSIPIFVGSSCIVGVDELMNKLVKQLAFDDHNQKGLKVVPILGLPGVGKTTAAGTLYHEHRGKFQSSAFVRISRTPDMRSLLISILLQIKAPWLWAFPDVHDLMDGIEKHLKGKRYFIILDGLWTASVWDIISRAFPDGNYGSRIVTTTQINDAALACCRYYPDYIEMSPLNDDQSRRLLFTTVFGSEDRCPSDFKEVSYKIIKKCSGLPLAIVNVASLLRRESNIAVEKWEHIQDSLPSILMTNQTTNEGMNDFFSDSVVCEGSQLARGTEFQKWKHTQDSFCSTFQGLKQVLGFVCNNLPPYLMTCLLYLSMYPEGSVVRKHDLVRLWVAESFMNAMGGRSAEEIAGDYFDELVGSGIVQPVHTKYGSEVLSCTVHHMVLDVIRQKSKEMNFIITVDHLQSWLALPDQVRRLSIQFGGAKSADIPENIMISKLRSLLFCGFIDCVPSVVEYEFLRVLILDIWADGDETPYDLTRISELLRLRYLKIQSNIMVNLPDEISGLKYLETLEVDARLSAVPSDIGRLEKLLHLLLPSKAILSQGHVIDLDELTNLQDLCLTCSTSTIMSEHLVGNMKHLASILGKLNSLRSLALHGDGGASSQSICDDGLISVSPSPALLEKLELRPRVCTLSRLPKWIGELSRLAVLKIEVLDLSDDDIAILEGLTSLTDLSLCVLAENVDWIVFEKGFPALKYFKFVRTAPYMSVVEGAMPNVQKLKLAFNANRLKPEYQPRLFGFKHMTSLAEVTVKFGGANADESTKGNAELVLKDAFSNNPSSPTFNAQWVDCIF